MNDNEQIVIKNFKYADMMMFSIKALKQYDTSDHMIAQKILRERDDKIADKADMECTRVYCCDGQHWNLLTFNAYDILRIGGRHEYFTTIKRHYNDDNNNVIEQKFGTTITYLDKKLIDSRLKAHDVLKIKSAEDVCKVLGIKFL